MSPHVCSRARLVRNACCAFLGPAFLPKGPQLRRSLRSRNELPVATCSGLEFVHGSIIYFWRHCVAFFPSMFVYSESCHDTIGFDVIFQQLSDQQGPHNQVSLLAHCARVHREFCRSKAPHARNGCFRN